MAWCVVVPPLVALTIYTIEVIAGLKSLRAVESTVAPLSIAVLIPAHDEAAGIGRTIGHLRVELGKLGRILVVADNCTDETAGQARDAGAEAIERNDPERRGKGYALSFGRKHLALDPPQVVVVLDADCIFMPGSLAPLVAVAASGRPAQALNLLHPDCGAPPLVQISSFALLVKNLIRGRGASRLGGAALLTGTGMAFPWEVFASAPLASSDIVEDLGLSIALLRAGVRPRLVEQAQVRSAPAGIANARSQRRRWEHGFLAIAMRYSIRLLLGGITARSRSLTALGVHLLVPPLALLFVVSGLALLAAGALALLAGNRLAPIALAFAMACAGGATLVAWVREGRAWLSPAALLRTPLYILWKLPLYAGFVRRPETSWVRTQRDED